MGYRHNIKSLMLDPTMGRLKIVFKLLLGMFGGGRKFHDLVPNIVFLNFLFVAKMAIILGKYRKNDDHQ
jgi:hypothetical protein